MTRSTKISTTRKKKKYRTTTTADLPSGIRRAAIAALLFAAVLVPARAAGQKPAASDGVIAGSVFNQSGRSVPGARVAVAPEGAPKIKRQAASDGRGEFAVRVPAGAGRYVVTVEAKGFAAQSKTVEVFESEKTSVTFLLEPR
jgi:hypothetical protein